MSGIIKALEQKYLAEIAEGEANIGVYIANPAGIGEHPDLVAAVDTQVARVAEAHDKLEIIREKYL
tara:strand:+ start:3553 stop:3750 length:198 start_codon:yes stop_codon:yes gene_type:complete